MNKLIPGLEKSGIFLLAPPCSPATFQAECRPLTYFLNFLKQMDVPRPIDFSYIPESGALISNLTLKENLFLEAIAPSLSSSKEFQFNEFLERTRNEFLLRLYRKIENLDLFPAQAAPCQQKLVCFLVALLKKSGFLFLEEPQAHLEKDPEIIFLLKKALRLEARSGPTMVVLYARDLSPWEDIISKTISQTPQGIYMIQAFKKGSGPDQEQGKEKGEELQEETLETKASLKFYNFDH